MDLTLFFHQYLDTTMIPKLQWKLVKDGGDQYVIYRWVNVVDGFDMPIQIIYNKNELKWIYPTQKWKKVKLPKGANIDQVKIDKRLFYIDEQNANDN